MSPTASTPASTATDTPSTRSEPSPLTTRERKKLKAIAHGLDPVVTVANKGVTEGVLAEVTRALNDHELIKIKVLDDRDGRNDKLAAVCAATGAQLIQHIGKIGVLLRRNPKANPKLSNLQG